MSWLKSDQTLARHPKTIRAARLLGISVPTIIGHLHLLWWWCLDYAETGELDGLDAEGIARTAMWEGDPEAFVEALVNAGPGDRPGFLEHSENGHLVVHDWDDYAGQLVRRREHNRKYMKEQRGLHVDTTSPPRGKIVGAQSRVEESRVEESRVERVDGKTPSQKIPHGEFNNVLLTDDQYKQIIIKFGEIVALEWVEELSGSIESKGYKSKSHYAAILSWARRRERERSPTSAHLKPPDQLSATEELMRGSSS